MSRVSALYASMLALLVSLTLPVTDNEALAARTTRIEASVDNRLLLPGDTLTYTLTVHNASGEVKPPDLRRDFRQVSRRSNSKNMFGERSQSWTFVLQPKRQGQITIEPAKLVQRGRIVQQTSPITIQVVREDALSDDPPSISLRCEPSQASLESEIRATIEIRVGKLSQDLDLGKNWAPGFQIVDGSERRRSSMATGSDGKNLQVTTLSVNLQPDRVGKHRLGPVNLISSGRIIAASPVVEITIVPPPPVSAEEARRLSWYKGTEPTIRAYTERDSYYISEPFLLRWDLVEGRQGFGSRFSSMTEPSLEGFSAKTVDVSDERTRIVVGDKRFVSRPLRAKVATGFKPGVRIIDAMTLRAADPFTGEDIGRVSSRPFRLLIKALPSKGQPEGFELGHIGRFEPTVEWPLREGDKLSTHQKIQLRVVIEGKGNLEGLVAPDLTGFSDTFSIEKITDRAQDQINVDETGVHGHRIFRYRITPLKPGKHAFPSFTFNYFDPTLAKYVSVEREGPLIEVTGNPVLDTSEGLGYAERDIGPIFEPNEFSHQESGHLTKRLAFWVIFLVPLALLLGFEARFRYKKRLAKDPKARLYREAHSNAKKGLQRAQSAMKSGEAKLFFDEIASTLEVCLTERFSIPAKGLQHQELKKQAVAQGAPSSLMDDIIAEFENCDFARFASSVSMKDTMEDTLRRTKALVEGIGSVTIKRGTR